MRVRVKAGEPKRPPASPQRRVSIPHDLVNEQVLIVAACASNDDRARLVRRAKPDDFLGKGHPEIWRALTELDRQALDFSPATIRQVSGGGIDGGYLDKLLAAYPMIPPNLTHHLEALQWDKVRVEAAQGPVSQLIKLLQDPTQPPDVVRAQARQISQAFEAAGGQLRYLLDPNELVRRQYADILNRRNGRATYPYGIDGLDFDLQTNTPRLIPGGAPGQITLMTGFSGSGKSTVTARVCLGQIEQGKRVLYGAWELDGGMTLELLAGMAAGLSRTKVITGALGDDEMDLLREWMEYVASYVRFFELPFGRVTKDRTSNEKNLDMIQQYLADAGVDFAIFDLWKRCLRFANPEDEELALYRQQAIAKETGVHCMIVHQQLMKGGDVSPDKRPTKEGNKGSATYVEIADTMIGTHRPALWKRIPDTTIEIIILKQRFGVYPAAVEFDWDGEFGSLKNGRTIAYDPPGSRDDANPGADFLSSRIKVDPKKTRSASLEER